VQLNNMLISYSSLYFICYCPYLFVV